MATTMEKQTLCEGRSDKPGANQLEYKEVIGGLQYADTISLLDISFATRNLQDTLTAHY